MISMVCFLFPFIFFEGNVGIELMNRQFIKMRGKRYYVYHSSTYWDKALKKPRTISKYLGTLDPDTGLIKSGGRHRIYPSDIKRS
jgi:hypothetical protein